MTSPAPQSLFRDEAVQARQRGWLGDVVLIRKPSFRLAVLASLLFICALVLLLATGSYTRRSTVSGQLVPDKGLIRIYPPMAGIVLERRVQEGMHVQAGDILFTLSADLGNDARRDMLAGIGEEMNHRRASLLAEMDLLLGLQQEEHRMLEQKITAITAELTTLQSQITAQSARSALAADNLARYRELQARQFISGEMLQQKHAELLEQHSRSSDLERARITLRESLAARRSELAALPQQQRNQRARLEREVSSSRQEILENESRRRLVVRAPQAGNVTAATANVGQSIERNQNILSLIPAGAQLQAELYAPSSAAGFIRPGQQVSLRYQAFPYQKFGRAYGRVLTVSRTALPAAELRLPFTPASGEPLYRVTVSLPAQAIGPVSDPHPLHAGMLLDADILLDKRKLYEWLLAPLYGISGRL